MFNLVPVNICSSVYLTPVYDLPTRGVPTKLLREAFVSLMEQPRNDATLRGVPIKLLREEFF